MNANNPNIVQEVTLSQAQELAYALGARWEANQMDALGGVFQVVFFATDPRGANWCNEVAYWLSPMGIYNPITRTWGTQALGWLTPAKHMVDTMTHPSPENLV
jgi:hypothetical protein